MAMAMTLIAIYVLYLINKIKDQSYKYKKLYFIIHKLLLLKLETVHISQNNIFW